eukprot:1232354-Rhodomonas_salina.1
MLDGESFLDIIRDENGDAQESNVRALTADESMYMTLSNCYDKILDCLHDTVAEFADVDGILNFGLPERPAGFRFSDMDLDELETHVLEEEAKKWCRYREAASCAEMLPNVRNIAKQSELFDTVTTQMHERTDAVYWHFGGGPAGTGKAYLAELLLHFARSQNWVAKTSAATWLAAGNFKDAVSIHSLFGLGIEEGVDAKPCAPSKSRGILLKHARLIVLDELPFLKRETFELIDEYLREMKKTSKVGHPVVVLACGDFRQLTPVMTGNQSPGAVFKNSILASPRWRDVKQTIFTELIRQQSDPEYGEFVQSIGDGIACDERFGVGCDEHEEKLRELYSIDDLPQTHADCMRATDFVCFERHIFTNEADAFIHQVFPDLDGAEESLNKKRAILASMNKQKDAWNQLVQDRRSVPKIVLPAQHVVKRGQMTEDEMADYHSVRVPDNELALKIRDVLLVTATVTVETGGICNNSSVRLCGISLNQKVLHVQKIGTSQTFLLPSQWFRGIPFGQEGVFDRLQFPVQLAYAMTVHKCQGQTMAFVGIDCTVLFFTHGQTYVAASRVTKSDDIAFFHSRVHCTAFCLNVVYHSFISQTPHGLRPNRRKRT